MSKCGQGDVAFDHDLKGVWEKPSSGYLENSISDSRQRPWGGSSSSVKDQPEGQCGWSEVSLG